MKAPRWQVIVSVIFLAMPRSPLVAADTQPASQSLDDQINALQQLVIKDEAPATDDTIPPASRHVNALRANVEGKDFRNALTQAKLIAGADPSPAVQKAIDTLIPALQAAGDAQTASVKQKLQSTLDQATKAVLTMKDPKDFDGVISAVSSALDQARAGAYGNGWDRQYAFTQLGSANRFLKQWQSYLIDQKAGNSQAVANDLRNLAEASDSFMPIPRSELLDLAQKALLQVRAPVATPSVAVTTKIELKSLDDLPGALNQIDLLRRTGNYNQQLNLLYNAMQYLLNSYRSYQDRNYSAALQQLVNNYPMMIGLSSPGAGTGDEDASLDKQLVALKNTLLLQIVQALLALPELPPPQKDELATDYLLGLAGAKEKSEDWTGLQQVLLVYQQVVGFNPAPWLQQDLTGLHAYFIGNKLEAAGQHLDAIRSYRQALATLGKFFPADPPAQQLDALQKKYPDLYQQALREPIN